MGAIALLSARSMRRLYYIIESPRSSNAHELMFLNRSSPYELAWDGKISWAEALERDQQELLTVRLRRALRKRWRIVPDNYLGYEVQVWRPWWPFWCEHGFTNTHASLDEARSYIEHHDLNPKIIHPSTS